LTHVTKKLQAFANNEINPLRYGVSQDRGISMRFTLVFLSKRHCFFQCAVLISALLSGPPLKALAIESHLQSGIAFFNAQKIRRALEEFRLAESEKPNDALTHYYLAVTLVKCKQFRKARPYFESAQQLAAPNSDVQRLAQAALKAFATGDADAVSAAKSAPAQSVSSGIAKTASGQLIPSLSVDGGAGTGGKGLIPNSDPGLNTFGHRAAKGRVWNAPPAGSNSGPSLSIGNTFTFNRYASSDPAANQALKLISKQAQAGIVTSLGGIGPRRAYQAIDYGPDSQMRLAAWRASADNLSSQLVSDHLTGSGIRLVPEGTSLHVRNYESFHSDDDDRANVVPLEAKSLSLKDVAQTNSSPLKAARSKSLNKDQVR
jgi:tetratricopeptide (TPR) repeat protein